MLLLRQVDAPQFELQIVQGSICIRLAILGPVGPETNQSPTKLLPAPAPFSRATGCAVVRADGLEGSPAS